MIAHCDASKERRRISDIYSKNENAIILIGPEGDFSGEEIDVAVNRDYYRFISGKAVLEQKRQVLRPAIPFTLSISKSTLSGYKVYYLSNFLL